ncbi:hypothetical protein [Pedobacter mucosus]|uniref:hypothetical protein n=1 Tax=Pedobacter mucosus TaxID=2895286 RepID=UPI001EE4AFED|nr:hypothetical protein [Pedobacter mucosus]UKT64496.1 hypothetical protein LOK61_01660 [Pedobacter mucosus]
MEETNIICEECGASLTDMNARCPNCNSEKKIVHLHFEERIGPMYESISGKKVDLSLPSKKKIVEKFFDGHDQSADGDWVYKKQIISREKDYYFEEVKISQGKIIHFCEEPLSEHRNHGSAKFKK